MDGFPQRRASGVLVQSLPDGSTLLFDSLKGEAHPISESARLVWDACDGQHSLADLTEILVEIYDAPRDRVAVDVLSLVESLASIGLLESGGLLKSGGPPG